MSVVVVGAGPAHAMYFSIYEHLKDRLQKSSNKPSYVGKLQKPTSINKTIVVKFFFFFLQSHLQFCRIYT